MPPEQQNPKRISRLSFQFKPIPVNLCHAMIDKNLSKTAILIYLYLIQRRNSYKGGIKTHSVTYEELGLILRKKESAIRRCIKELKDSGLITFLQKVSTNNGDGTFKNSFFFEITTGLPAPTIPTYEYQSQGYIYLIYSDNYGTKIGRTKTPADRTNKLSSSLPFHTEVIHIAQYENMIEAESFFHETFAHKRLNGEWFDLTDDDIEFIKAHTEGRIYDDS